MSTQKAVIIKEDPKPPVWGVVADIPIPQPQDGQMIVKTIAYAANPTDWKHVLTGEGKPGNIMGTDASGVVVKVGKDVTGFQVGDSVGVFSHGNYSPTRGCFAEYIVTVPETTVKYTTPLKDGLPVGEYRSGTVDSYEGAAAITLGLTTTVLSFAGNMNIKAEHKGKYILIWGGATATGILAIQIAKLGFGLKVITTASKKNHEYLKSLGADVTIDYNDSDAIEQVKTVGGSEIRYALDAVSTDETWQQVYDATASSTDVTLDNLFFKTEKDLKTSATRAGKTTIAPMTLVYVIEEGALDVFGLHFDALDPAALARYKEFWFNVLPSILPQIQHPKLRVLAPGLESANEAIALVHYSKVSAEKAVFHK